MRWYQLFLKKLKNFKIFNTMKIRKLLQESNTQSIINTYIPFEFTSKSKEVLKSLDGIKSYFFYYPKNEDLFNSKLSNDDEAPDYGPKSWEYYQLNLISPSDWAHILSKLKPKFKDKFLSQKKDKIPTVHKEFLKWAKSNLNFNDFQVKLTDTLDDSLQKKLYNKIKDVWEQNDSKKFAKFELKDSVYHVSKNTGLKPGDIIKPYFDAKKYAQGATAGNFGASKATAAFVIADELVEKYRPSSLPSRKKSVFVFKTIKDAIRYGGAAPVYAVSVGKHIWADMNVFDNIAAIINDTYEAADYHGWDEKELQAELVDMAEDDIKKYWSGKPGRKPPVWEGISNEPLTVLKRVK